MHLKHWGRRTVNTLGLAEIYARYRDGRLLNAERTGKFDGDFEKLWRLLSR